MRRGRSSPVWLHCYLHLTRRMGPEAGGSGALGACSAHTDLSLPGLPQVARCPQTPLPDVSKCGTQLMAGPPAPPGGSPEKSKN